MVARSHSAGRTSLWISRIVNGWACVSSAAMIARRGPVNLRDFSRKRSITERFGGASQHLACVRCDCLRMRTWTVHEFPNGERNDKEANRTKHNRRTARNIQSIREPDSQDSPGQPNDKTVNNLLAQVPADISRGGRRQPGCERAEKMAFLSNKHVRYKANHGCKLVPDCGRHFYRSPR